MKKVLFLSLVIVSVLFDTSSFAAPAARRGRASGGNAPAATTNNASAGQKTTAARAATNSRTAPAAAAPAKTGGRTTGTRGGAAPAAGTPTVAARAATTQKVIGTGTKVTGAAKNIVVSEECQAKYDGCMDSFCMLDNESGGRCVCSDKNAEFDAILAEIEKLDEQSYQMATFGVEKLEMGEDADAAIAAANSVADSFRNNDANAKDGKKKARKALDLSMWNASVDFEEEEDVFAGSSDANSLEGKEGDALHKAAAALCKAQIPECAKDINMLQMMYGQRIKSDCTAYENSLKQKKTQSSQKLQAAEKALRETALEQYQNANKYDLGQCTIKFKECMQTTGGCGADFSKCASVAAFDSTNTRQSTSKKAKNYQVQGAISNIEISASTYDALMSKKPLCETVTKQCTKVASQVWDTFLKEIAPQLKSAEIIAEDNARQDCIGNISECFQKACKDTMDPNDPDGSYDMCLSRPETMLNVCKVPLNACGIDASSATAAQKSNIWEFVTARLAAMRVDACTVEVKECLQAEDRCGKDYLNCIGLDTYTIVNMCPRDKLTACYSSEYGDNEQAREEYIYSVAQGLILNIDNEMMAQCQKAANEAMIKVCGDTLTCDNMTIADGVGAHSLEYKVCEYADLASVSISVDEGDDISLPNYGAGYVFHNCKQDVNLILDEDLLGTVNYDQGTKPENYLDLSTVEQIDAAILANLERMASNTDKAIENSYKVGELTNEGDTLGQLAVNAMNNSVKESRIKYTNREIKKANNLLGGDIQDTLFELRKRAKGQIKQQDVNFTIRTYSGVKQFMGVIDGIIAWNKINLLTGDYCPVDNPENTDKSDVMNLGGSSASKVCMSGIADAVFSGNLGQNGVSKQNQILSDLGALRNSVSNTIFAIESDPTVQFCMTGRKVQGLKMGLDGKAQRTEARFPNLTDSMKTVIAQAALKKAQDNYNKRYKELDEQLRKDNLVLAERIIKVREDRDAADRTELAARACLNLGANAALPVSTDPKDASSRQSGQGYTATSTNDDPYYRETVTTTFSPTTLVCKKCTRSQTCTKQKGYKDGISIDSRYCKAWADPVESCTETQF